MESIKPKTDTVVPIRAPAALSLTEDERLRIENFTLKAQIAQDGAMMKIAKLRQKVDAVGREAGKRLGIEILDYVIDLGNGELTPIKRGSDAAEDQDHGKPQVDGEDAG